MRKLMSLALCTALTAVGLMSNANAQEAKPGNTVWVYIGTYTNAKGSQGIYKFDMNTQTGELSNKTLAGTAVNPSFLALHPTHKFLYAVGEISNFEGKKAGGVSAFAIEPKTGKLTLLNQHSSGGAGPCHLVVDQAGKNVIVANYGGGSAAVLPIEPDGKLKAATSFVQHAGTSPDGKPLTPHAHSANLDASNKFAFIADLGLDQVLVYKLDGTKGTITPNNPPYAKVSTGSGPRHFAFHPSNKYAYVINERTCTVTAFSYDADKGELQELQTITTLPHPVMKGYSTAEVQVHKSGKFLYGSNRGHNSIAVFKIDEATGKLTPVQIQGAGVNIPRNFGIDPTGNFMIVGNQAGDSIIVFRIDQTTGELKETGIKADVHAPVCIKFMSPQ